MHNQQLLHDGIQLRNRHRMYKRCKLPILLLLSIMRQLSDRQQMSNRLILPNRG